MNKDGSVQILVSREEHLAIHGGPDALIHRISSLLVTVECV